MCEIYFQSAKYSLNKRQETFRLVKNIFKNMTETMKKWSKFINLLRKIKEDTSFHCELGRAHQLRAHFTVNQTQPEHARFAECHYSCTDSTAVTKSKLLGVVGYSLPLFSPNHLTVNGHDFKGFFKREKELTFR